jgi:hypothetical protein
MSEVCCLLPFLREGEVPVFISPINRVAHLYTRALSSLCVSSYNSQDYAGGILTFLHHLNEERYKYFPLVCMSACVSLTVARKRFSGKDTAAKNTHLDMMDRRLIGR